MGFLSDKAQSQFEACQRDKHEGDCEGSAENKSNLERVNGTTLY
jgi:hypothetical protein